MYLKISLSSAIAHKTQGIGNMVPVRLAWEIGQEKRPYHACERVTSYIHCPMAKCIHSQWWNLNSRQGHRGFIRINSEQRNKQSSALKKEHNFFYIANKTLIRLPRRQRDAFKTNMISVFFLNEFLWVTIKLTYLISTKTEIKPVLRGEFIPSNRKYIKMVINLA